MTEVWKSQKKKFCEICKCWFADNLASVRHHENGQRHKANMKERISELGKRSREEEKEKQALNATLAMMNAAAHQSFAKDMEEGQPDSQPTYGPAPHPPKQSEQFGGNRKNVPVPAAPMNPMYPGIDYPDWAEDRKHGASVSIPPPAFNERQKYDTSYESRMPTEPHGASSSSSNAEQEAEGSREKTKSKSKWAEARTPDGMYVYYWNTESGQSSWTIPPEGFVSIAEQEMEIAEATAAKNRKKKMEEDKSSGEKTSGPIDVKSEILAAVEDSQTAQKLLEKKAAASKREEDEEWEKSKPSNRMKGSAKVAFKTTQKKLQPATNAFKTESSESDSEGEEEPSTSSAKVSAATKENSMKVKKEEKRCSSSSDEAESDNNDAVDDRKKSAPKQAPEADAAAAMPGKWTTVSSFRDQEEELPDLGLPTMPESGIEYPEFTMEDDEDHKVKFQEKTVSAIKSAKGMKSKKSGDGGGGFAFKKRKLGSGVRNARKRDGD